MDKNYDKAVIESLLPNCIYFSTNSWYSSQSASQYMLHLWYAAEWGFESVCDKVPAGTSLYWIAEKVAVYFQIKILCLRKSAVRLVPANRGSCN